MQGSPRNSGDFSRDTASGHHHGTGGRIQRPQGDRSRRQDPSAVGPKPPPPQQQQQPPPQGHAGQQRSGGQGQSGRHPGSEPLDVTQLAQQQSGQQQQQQQQQSLQHSQTSQSSQPSTITAGAAPQQPKPGQTPPQGRQPGGVSAAGQLATTTVVSRPQHGFILLIWKIITLYFYGYEMW